MVYRRTFPWVRTLFILALLSVAGYLLWPVLFSPKEAPKVSPAAHVAVSIAQVMDVPLFFDYSARLAGSREVEIRPRVGGILLRRAYTEGQFVKQGSLLFQIDPAPYQAVLEQSKASYEQAAKEWKRAQGLKRDQAISPREYDAAQSSYGQAKAALDTAKINLAYTAVRAPISGYTSEEGFSEGSLVTADTSVLTRLTQLDPMYVEFAYPDTEATQQRLALANGSMRMPENKKLTAEIRLENGTVYPVEGEIRFTDHIVDTSTGTVRARAVVANKEKGLLPGQFVRVVVKGFTQVQTIALPEKAIMQGPQGTFVYVVDAENKAKVTPVTLGPLNRGQQLIASGLKQGDQVIVEGMIKVKPDAVVTIDTGEAPATAPPKVN